jgi:hypothetical protein
LRKVSGHAIDGILGMSFLSTQVIHLNFDRGKIYFLKGSGTQASDSFPLHLGSQGEPLVDVDVPGAGTRRFLVNTGSAGYGSGALDQGTFADLLRNGLMRSAGEIRVASLTGMEVNRRGEVRGLSLGTLPLPTISVEESDLNELGLGFLGRFNATFDFPGRLLYLTKSRYFGEPDRFDRSGLHFIREHGDTIIEVVDRGSPAEASGLQPRDVLTELAGKSVSQMRMRSLRLLFCTEGATVPVTIRRGQQQIAVTLRLGTWLLEEAAKLNRQNAKEKAEKKN